MLNNLISELTAKLKEEINQSLISIVLFGSSVKGNSTATSDIDVIVICGSLIKDWRARDNMSLAITEDIESKYSIPIHMTLVNKEEI